MNSKRVAELLEQYPGIENHRDAANNTPLHYASLNLDTKTMKLLIDRGAKVNVINDNGQSPLHFIAMQRLTANSKTPKLFREAARILSNAGPDDQDNEGNTPLHILADSEVSDPRILVDMAATLINNRADINILNEAGKTAKDLVIENQEREISYAIKDQISIDESKDLTPDPDEIGAKITAQIGSPPLLKILNGQDKFALLYNKFRGCPR